VSQYQFIGSPSLQFVHGRRLAMRPNPSRTAFTLIELLVTLSIIGILIALLLPAVQFARESARQTTCRNNQHQIGVALHAYHNVHHSLPIGCLEWRGWGQPATRKNLAWSAFLLPFIEQPALYEAIEFDLAFDHPLNVQAAATAVETYLCPTALPRGGPRGELSYGGLYGERLVDRRSDDGVFLYDRIIAFRDCFDGLSTTIAIGEDVLGPDSEWINGGNVFVQAHRINDPDVWVGDNEIRSLHPAGAMLLMLDGSTHLVNESIDTQVLGHLITRDRREIIPNNAF
jgi:prepilin-type N-terminal cleavage/methylation domain-containing protein